MSASDQMRAMLAELMGTSHDGGKPSHDCTFDDSRVCKSFLLECCPYDLLSNTRMDMGECPKLHDIALRADYNNAQLKKDYYYDLDCLEHLQKFIVDCDHRTELAKKRLKETQEELSEESAMKIEVINGYGERIGTKLAKAEELGAAGNVEESLKLMEEVEELKKQKAAAENEYRNTMPTSQYQQQKLRVCEVCSAFLGIHDNDRRLADHFGGRLHMGFITLRTKLDELKENVAERIAKRDKEREERRKTMDEADSRRRGDTRRRSRTPERRRRSRTPDRRRKSRTPDRRRKSRTPDRRRRSRTPERRRKSKTPERRRRSRTPDRRRRSRTPDRRRRSRERRASRERVERRRSRSTERRGRDSREEREDRRRKSSRERSKSGSRRSNRSRSKLSSSRKSRSPSPRRSDSSSAHRVEDVGMTDGSKRSRGASEDKEQRKSEECEARSHEDDKSAGSEGMNNGEENGMDESSE